MIKIDDISLNGQWSFAYDDTDRQFSAINDVKESGLPVYNAIVPGNFELDLQANGIIDDPFYGMNIVDLTQYEKCHIWYFRTFTVNDFNGYKAELVFEGLDCIADVYLNGELICSYDNMLIEQISDASKYLNDINEILIHIKPAVLEAAKYNYPPLLEGIYNNNLPSLYVRKAPHMYGWDIMPKAVSAGIWRPVYIRFKTHEHIDSLFLETKSIASDRKTALLTLYYQMQITDLHSAKYEIEVKGKCGDSEFNNKAPVTFNAGRLNIHTENPMLWWPKGRGDANLYEISVILYKDGAAIDSSSFKHGIRTVKLNRTSITNAYGTGEFCFIVNGEKVFVLGTNWVPADVYHSRDIMRLPEMLELVDDIGCNMIRCWGGNVYENDLFYDFCDKHGIMIWQDFAMACGIYPQDNEFSKRLSIEVRSVVKRLRKHPSIVLWSGDNECDLFWCEYGKDPNQNILTRKVIPDVLKEEDWTRPYLPSSPYVDETAYNNGLVDMSEDHLWGPRDYYKGDYYSNSNAHFASEIGYHGSPSPESIRKFISPEKVWHYSSNSEWILHSTSPIPGINLYDYRVELMAKQIRELFGEVPDNINDFTFASQISQLEAKKFFIEKFRSEKWRRAGIIWWNLIDGWPQFSDAVVDYYFSKKLSYNAIKIAQTPVLPILKEPHDGIQELVICNDTRFDIEAVYRISDADTCEVYAEGAANSRKDSVTSITNLQYKPDEQIFYVIDWNYNNIAYRSHYLAGKTPFDLMTYKKRFNKTYNTP